MKLVWKKQKNRKTAQKMKKNSSNVRHFLSNSSTKKDSYPKLPILITKQLEQLLLTSTNAIKKKE